MKRWIGFAVCCAWSLAFGLSVPVPPPDDPGRFPRLILPPPAQQQAGDPMQTREMSVTARISGLFAEVETTLSFYNPNARPLEGELVFPLPDGAAVCGYALDVNGQLVDGVVVKKEKARVAFETETRRRVDPGLVEYVKGNVYRTRIYPLPPKAARTVRLRYVTELASDARGDAALHLPLPRDTVGTLNVRIEVARGTVQPEVGGFGNLRFAQMRDVWLAETSLRDTRPGQDILVALPRLPATVAAVERDPASGEVFFSLSDVRPPAAVTPPSMPVLAIAWDASGSRDGVAIAQELAFLEALGRAAKTERFRLLVFRDAPEAERSFASFAELRAALEALRCDGGTDFSALARALPSDTPWLLFTDGLDTLSGDALSFAGRRVTAVVSQSVGDRESLRQACGDAGGCVIDLQRLGTAEAVSLALAPPRRVAGLQGTGLAAVQGAGAVAAGRVALTGRLTADSADVRVTYSDGTLSDLVTLRKADAAEGRLLATAWGAGRVLRLAPQADRHEEALLDLGRRFGLVSPATSLLVLESLDQYLRHDVEPPAMLAEMRRQWHDARARASKEQAIAKRSKLETVVALWQTRVAWWEQTFNVPKDFRWKEALPAAAGHPSSSGLFHSLARRFKSAAAADAYSGEVHVNVAEERLLPAAAPAPASAAEAKKEASADGAADASIQVAAWNPDTPYLKRLKAAAPAEREAVYAEQRKTSGASPAFYLDCADFLLREGDAAAGLRVLSNLAELRIEDAALLRVLAWRLQQAGALDRAVVVLRRVTRLRPEDPQSWRDLALALAERGKAGRAAADLEEAMALFDKVIFGTWNRTAEIEITALEELNALIAWIERAEWTGTQRPEGVALDPRLRQNLDVDVRISLAWDADATDVDLHVLEPTGEEAFFSHNRTHIGGLVSRDITDGYGPEEYLVRRAFAGVYTVKAKYYGSRQQTVIGPATLTATVFTDWGRATERKQTLTLRLDKPHDIVDLGRVTIGGGKSATAEAEPAPLRKDAEAAFEALRVGLTAREVEAALGPAAAKSGSASDEVWTYRRGERTWRVTFRLPEKRLQRVAEVLPGNAELIVVQ